MKTIKTTFLLFCLLTIFPVYAANADVSQPEIKRESEEKAAKCAERGEKKKKIIYRSRSGGSPMSNYRRG